jgi:hypothetical protein
VHKCIPRKRSKLESNFEVKRNEKRARKWKFNVGVKIDFPNICCWWIESVLLFLLNLANWQLKKLSLVSKSRRKSSNCTQLIQLIIYYESNLHVVNFWCLQKSYKDVQKWK